MKLVIPEGVKRIYGNFSEVVYRDPHNLSEEYWQSGNWQISRDGQDYYVGGDRDQIEKVQLPSTLEEIHENAFILAKRLDRIKIPAGVRFIGKKAFKVVTT